MLTQMLNSMHARHNIKCAFVFRAILTNAISKAMIVSYEFALRHISMRRFYLLSNRSNSRSSDLHMLAKIFRVNSRFWFTFFDSRKSFIQLQSADVVKNISSSICLAVDSHRSSRELKALKYSWESLSWESVDLKKLQKLFVFRIFH